nr:MULTISPECIES: spore germination protein [unclassified Dehalobacter]
MTLLPSLQQSAIRKKPDIVSAKMLEGRIAILIDSTPFVLKIGNYKLVLKKCLLDVPNRRITFPV